jgi:hypothetical protein
LIENVDEMISLRKSNNETFYEDMLVGDTLNKHMPNIKKLHITEIYPFSRCEKHENLMIGHYINRTKSWGHLDFYEHMQKMHRFYTK